MLSVCSVIGDQRDDAAANDKCHRKCTLAQPVWIPSFVLSLCCGERDLYLSSCFRALTSPNWALDPGVLLAGCGELTFCTSGSAWGGRASWKLHQAEAVFLSSSSPSNTHTLFPNWALSQCEVLGQWVIPLDTNRENRGQGEHTGEITYLVCG